MGLTILSAGMQATLQGVPRLGFRHQGVPASGPADTFSHSLGKIVLGNTNPTSLEITGGGFKAVFNEAIVFSLSGAPCSVLLNDQPVSYYEPIQANPNDILFLPPPSFGARIYLSVKGGFVADIFLGSTSTYLPAQLGGFKGRALCTNDQLTFARTKSSFASKSVPESLRPYFSNQWVLRYCIGPEFSLLDTISSQKMANRPFLVGRRLSRMGIQLEDNPLTLMSDGRMKSVPVFPGTIQCPENGLPFILLADAQTTGGYPRIGQIASCDRHRLGQIKTGDKISLVRISPEEAIKILKVKKEALHHISSSL